MAYIDVFAGTRALDEMLALTSGVRKVPVIVEGDQVTVGYQGKG